MPGKEQNANDYIDAWLAPETGKWLIENYGYGHTNRNVFDLVTAEVLEEKGLGLARRGPGGLPMAFRNTTSRCAKSWPTCTRK